MAKAAELPEYPQADQADNCPHPRSVYDLIGHQWAEQRLAGLWASGRMPHALMLTGPRGVGKATLAYRLIRTILGGARGSADTLDVPATDVSAQRIESLGHGDFLLIRRPYNFKTGKLAAEIPIDESRRVPTFFHQKSSEGGWQVCLIDTIDEMNIKATNAVLKILEEPPDKAVLILLSHTPGRLLPTIRSRCVQIALRGVPADELQPWLENHSRAAPSTDITKLAAGAPGHALALLHNERAVIDPLRSFLSNLPQASSKRLHAISDGLATQKAAKARTLFLDAVMLVLAEQAKYASTGEWDGPFSPIARPRSAQEWVSIRDEIAALRGAAAAINMNPKLLILETLQKIAS